MLTIKEHIEQKLVHSVHTSERRSFRGCRRRWSWIFQEFYYPTVTPKPLEFGVAFHVGMEHLYDPDTWHDWNAALGIAKVKFKEKVKEQLVTHEKFNGPIDGDTKADYDERVKLGLGMLDYYAKTVMPKFDKGYKPVKVEVKFEVPVTGPDGEQLYCKCDICKSRWRNSLQGAEHHDAWQKQVQAPLALALGSDFYLANIWQGLPVTFGGRLDMLAEDEDGRYWIFDWKSAAVLHTGDAQNATDEFLVVEDQITGYCAALRKLGLDIAGFVYAEIKKAVPGEPEPMTRRYKGRLYSTNKQASYDPDLYAKIVEENDPEAFFAGEYDEYIEHLRLSVFHVRHQVHRNSDELDSADYNLWLEASDMVDQGLRLYPSPGRFSCESCAFLTPCVGKNRGEDYQYYLDSMFEKRTRHYYEDAPASTDKTGRG